MRLPLKFFDWYWSTWSVVSTLAVLLNWQRFFIPLVVAFLVVEFLGLFFTEKDAGTLTVVTSQHIPEDFTFILMGLINWRVSQWLNPGHMWMVWILCAWLVQHFIRHYQARA